MQQQEARAWQLSPCCFQTFQSGGVAGSDMQEVTSAFYTDHMTG